MFNKLLGRLINNNEYKLAQIRPIVGEINSLEKKFESLSDEDIKKQTRKWQKELRSGNKSAEEINEYLEEILPHAAALVREAAKRTMNERHRDVQLMSGIVLHQGKISEQRTGEGKTLTATLPLYLNSLTGKGAHLVTPNDYLSMHGAGWYGPVYQMLGVSHGVIVDRKSYLYDPEFLNEETKDPYEKHLKPVSRVEAYKADITYGTNHEFGFDYLRDNMAMSGSEIVQTNPNEEKGSHNFAIVDEVDNILVDIARTPLIISTQRDLKPESYYEFAKLADGLILDTDYELDEKENRVTLTEIGISKIERKLGVKNLYEKDFETIHRIENALKAKALHIKDKDYVLQDGQVIIVDQNTGRLLHGNRWGNGLHQAVEAKEGVQIQAESKTIATISYQNYYRLYSKLAGMTGTAETEAEEFFKMYSLDVVVIPTHKEIARLDHSDIVYKTTTSKYRAIANAIAERHKKGQPVLIGTTSVEKSQLLSTFLNRLNIPHQTLNAKQHDKEAHVIAQAGKKGAVTVSTNMAGRGVDIILGGDPFDSDAYKEIVKLGGLYVIGTERHDSRRIDNQLRGRSGRQGDPGESRFILSLQDDLLRVFGGEKIEAIMGRLGVDENIPIEAKLISRTIESAQKKVEGMNFDVRRSLVEYDDVMNVQREAIYGMRRQILYELDNTNDFFNWIKDKLSPYETEKFWKKWDSNVKEYGEEVWNGVVRRVCLEVISVLWMDHIDTMDDLRSGVRLRGYGQVNPLVEYKREGKELFERLLDKIWSVIVDRLDKIEVRVESQLPEKRSDSMDTDLDYSRGRFESGIAEESNIQTNAQNARQVPVVKSGAKVGRNDPCPCGSGKKYKLCHGKIAR